MGEKKSSRHDAAEPAELARPAAITSTKAPKTDNGSSQVAGRAVQQHQLSAGELFAAVDHGELPRPEIQPALAEPEPAELAGELEPECNPLSDMVVAVAAIGARMLDEENPLTDAERAELHDATAALERRYAPYLENAGDALLWGRMAITVGVVFQPRVAKLMERKREERERLETDAARIAGKERVGKDMGPSVAAPAPASPSF